MAGHPVPITPQSDIGAFHQRLEPRIGQGYIVKSWVVANWAHGDTPHELYLFWYEGNPGSADPSTWQAAQHLHIPTEEVLGARASFAR